jgi:hypothetical protein
VILLKKHQPLRIIITILCVVIVLIIAPADILQSKSFYFAATDKEGVKKGLELYKQGKYKEAREQFMKYPKVVSEPSDNNMSKRMKKAYFNRVLKFKTFAEAMENPSSYIWDYYLTDIDKDGKTELLIQHGTCEADSLITIYRYRNGSAKKVKSIHGGHSSLYAFPDGNGFIRRTGHMGYETIYLDTLNGTKIVEHEIGTREIGNEEYMYLPYGLASHKASDGLNIDYSALR